ncbi:MAG: hypothetical protein R2712_24750 [Vicinamibacterales bacterium]
MQVELEGEADFDVGRRPGGHAGADGLEAVARHDDRRLGGGNGQPEAPFGVGRRAVRRALDRDAGAFDRTAGLVNHDAALQGRGLSGRRGRRGSKTQGDEYRTEETHAGHPEMMGGHPAARDRNPISSRHAGMRGPHTRITGRLYTGA